MIARSWHLATGLLVERLKEHNNGVYYVVFCPDGQRMVSGRLDKTLKYWDIAPLREQMGQDMWWGCH